MGLFGVNSGINQGYEGNRAQLNRRPKMEIDLASPNRVSLSRRPITAKATPEKLREYRIKYQLQAKKRRRINALLMIGVVATLIIGVYSLHLFLETQADKDFIISTYLQNSGR